jgi:hypothetical protein
MLKLMHVAAKLQIFIVLALEGELSFLYHFLLWRPRLGTDGETNFRDYVYRPLYIYMYIGLYESNFLRYQ